MTDVNLTGEAREAYMEAIAKKSVNLTEDERMAFMDALMRESAQATEAKQNRVYSQRGDDYLIEAQKVCAEDKPKPPVVCPYCGHKMVHQYVYGDHFFRCPKCRAVAPEKDTEAKAYAAAMQRWQEPNVPLALEELIEYGKNPSNAPAWYEYRGLSEVGCWIDVEQIRDIDYDDPENTYGKHWRCWLRKPTYEEMEAVPGGDD